MNHKRIHHKKIKNRYNHLNRIQVLRSSRLFIVLGLIFILIGIYFSVNSTGWMKNLYNIVENFFLPTENSLISESKGKGIEIFYIYFLPATIVLIISILFSKKYFSICYPLIVIVIIYLITIHTLILKTNFTAYDYPSFFIASFFFLFLPVLILFVSAILIRKTIILILSSFYFYVSIGIYITYFAGRFSYLFIFILFFSIAISWIGKQIARQYINIINFMFVILIFGLFWLKKFIINSKPEFLQFFFYFSILLYILFYGINLYSSNSKGLILKKWMQLILSWSNLLFFLITTSIVIIKYYSIEYLWILIPALLLFNLIGVYFIEKHTTYIWTLPYHFICIFLTVLILPLLFQKNIIINFAVGLSILMLIYSSIFKNKLAFQISLIMTVLLVMDFFYYWTFSYCPSLFDEKIILNSSLMINGIINGVLVISALTLIQWLLKDVEVPLSKKWFNKSKYIQMIRLLILNTLFLTIGWIGFSLLIQITGTINYSSVGWFISGSAFFIILIKYYSGEKSTFKKPILYFGFAFTLLYPLFVHMNMITYRDSIIRSGNIEVVPVIIHYIALGLLVALVSMTIWRIYFRNMHKITIKRGLLTLTTLFLIFLLCTEYDNISILVEACFNKTNNIRELLDFNQHLPFTIIIWFVAIVVFVWGIYRHNIYMRSFSVIIFIGTLIKVFAYDFEVLDAGARGFIFLCLGAFLIGFALLYPKFNKINKMETNPKINTDNTER